MKLSEIRALCCFWAICALKSDLAAFLLNLSQRLYSRGFAANDFILRMSREEIGSYLGLKLETVSRTLSKFIMKA